MYNVYSILYNVHYTVYTVQCKMYTVQCAMYIVHYTVHSVKVTDVQCTSVNKLHNSYIFNYVNISERRKHIV